MSKIESYQDLDVWQQCRLLVKMIYQITRKFPQEEQFGLIIQLRRGAISVCSNLAEGCGRDHSKDSVRFFFISRGSLYELETQIVLAPDLEFISKKESQSVLDQVIRCKKLINGFITYYQKQTINDQPTTTNETLEEYGNNYHN